MQANEISRTPEFKDDPRKRLKLRTKYSFNITFVMVAGAGDMLFYLLKGQTDKYLGK